MAPSASLPRGRGEPRSPGVPADSPLGRSRGRPRGGGEESPPPGGPAAGGPPGTRVPGGATGAPRGGGGAALTPSPRASRDLDFARLFRPAASLFPSSSPFLGPPPAAAASPSLATRFCPACLSTSRSSRCGAARAATLRSGGSLPASSGRRLLAASFQLRARAAALPAPCEGCCCATRPSCHPLLRRCVTARRTTPTTTVGRGAPGPEPRALRCSQHASQQTARMTARHGELTSLKE